MNDTSFAIPTQLLTSTQKARPWSNLGDWSQTNDYDAACAALARRVGHAAQLRPGDTLLELACGYGASFDVWTEFSVAHVDAVEIQAQAVAAIEANRPGVLRNLLTADADSVIPSQETGLYDALVVVDAAYHFKSLRGFLTSAAPRLRPDGRLAFTTLVLSPLWMNAPSWKKKLIHHLAAQALIPKESLVNESDLNAVFTQTGWNAPVCQRLNHEVLGGFANFVDRRRSELKVWQRLSSGWWKVRVTAAAARYLVRTGLLHYVLLHAMKA